jgi:hypothetical protein
MGNIAYTQSRQCNLILVVVASPERINPNREKRPFIQGSSMICPRCKHYHNILEYIAMKMIDMYAEDTTPVYKCPRCRWAFAPAEPILLAVGPLVREDTASQELLKEAV